MPVYQRLKVGVNTDFELTYQMEKTNTMSVAQDTCLNSMSDIGWCLLQVADSIHSFHKELLWKMCISLWDCLLFVLGNAYVSLSSVKGNSLAFISSGLYWDYVRCFNRKSNQDAQIAIYLSYRYMCVYNIYVSIYFFFLGLLYTFSQCFLFYCILGCGH